MLWVRMNHCNAGFFAQVQFALNQIRFAESRGLLPVVHFGRDSVDGPNAYFDEDAGPNVWDYYFEPVAGVTLDEARALAASSGRRVLTPSYWELWRLHYREPRSLFTYPYGYYGSIADKADPRWWARQRALGRRLVRRHVRVRAEIAARVEAFAAANFTRPVLGVHARGTDKQDVGAGPHLSRIVPPEEYFPLVDGYIDRHPGARIFFATDQRQFRDRMRGRYGDRLLTVAETLSDSDVNAFQRQRPTGRGNRDKGEEVLVDALLLSRCDFLLKCTSAVGEFAQYFSDSLTSIDLNLVGLPQAPRRSLPGRTRAALLEGRVRLGLEARAAVGRWRGSDLEDADRPSVPDDVMHTNRFVAER